MSLDDEVFRFRQTFEATRSTGRNFAPMFAIYKDEKQLASCICRGTRHDTEMDDKQLAFAEMFALVAFFTPFPDTAIFCSDSYFTMHNRMNADPSTWIRPKDDPNHFEALHIFAYSHLEDQGRNLTLPYIIDDAGKMWWVNIEDVEWVETNNSEGFIPYMIHRMFQYGHLPEAIGIPEGLLTHQELVGWLRQRGHRILLHDDPHRIDVVL